MNRCGIDYAVIGSIVSNRYGAYHYQACAALGAVVRCGNRRLMMGAIDRRFAGIEPLRCQKQCWL